MDGFRTALAFYDESAPGVLFRPAGLSSVRVSPKSLQSWTRRTPFEKRSREKSLIEQVNVSIQRAFLIDDLCRMLVECVCDSTVDGAGAIGPDGKASNKTFGMHAAFPDGACFKYSGLALKSWSITIQSKRTITEEMTFVALRRETLESVTGATPPVAPFSAGWQAEHRIDLDLPDVTSADWPGGGTRAFSTQIIFDRELNACNFSNDGRAERHSYGVFDVSGHGVVRLPPDDFSPVLMQDTEAAMYWRITNGENSLKIALPAALLRANNQEAIAGEIEHTVDFHSHSAAGYAAFIAS